MICYKSKSFDDVYHDTNLFQPLPVQGYAIDRDIGVPNDIIYSFKSGII